MSPLKIRGRAAARARVTSPFAALGTGLLLSLPVAAGAQGYPKAPPAPAAVKPTPLPPLQESLLPNGTRLVLVEDHRLPVVSIALSLPAGSVYDPKGKEGLAFLTANLLTKGAGTRSADEISSTIEGVGGSISAGAGQDFATVRADVMSGDAALAFGLVADAVARPTFPDKEVELARTQTLSGLQLQLAQPASIADRVFRHELYGSHPYGRSSTPASVKAITRDDIVRFHASRLRPQGALLVVAGDLTLADARRLATEAFKGWTGAPAAAPALPAVTPATKSEIVLVHRPGSVQSNILVGRSTFGPADPRYYALAVGNRLFGGGSNARLFSILREQHGWTYGAYSSLSRPKGMGYFYATAEVRNPVTDSSLKELLVQMRKLGSEPVPASELDMAKNAITGSFPLSIETANQVANAVANMKLLGLPADYLRSYRTRMAAVTPAQVQAAAKQVVRPEASVIVVVGDAEQIYDKLKALGPVRVVNVQGEPISMAALSDKGTAAAFDVSKLVPRTDSFVVLVQGNAFGYDKETIEKTATGYRVTGESKLGPIMSYTTEMVMGPKGEMITSKQDGTIQGQAMKVDVAYAGGRARGSATMPSQQGMRSITVDTTVPPGVVDERALTTLLSVLPWAPNAKFGLPLFLSSENALRQATLAVAGTEKVTVPAGTFDTWRVEMTGGKVPTTFYIEAAAPHRLIRMAPSGQPVELQLAK